MTSKITTQWHNPEKTVILVVLERGWTWGDMYQTANEIYMLLDSVEHSVCTIIDFSSAKQIPPRAITHIKNLNKNAHPNQTKLAFVGLNSLASALMNTFVQLYGAIAEGADVKLVPSIDSAYEFFNIEYNSTQLK